MERVDPGWIDLRAHLRGLGPEPVHYKPNPGNGGDALIALATLEILEECGVRYRLWRDGDDPTGKTILYGGGGNLVPHYTYCADFLARHHERAGRLILLPHTIRGHEELLGRLGANVDLLCRERQSLAHARRAAPRANVLLAEDLALGLDPASVLAVRPTLVTVQRRWRFLRRTTGLRIARWLRQADASLGGAGRILHCFRGDVEASGRAAPPRNIDLSEVAPHDPRMICPRSIARTVHEIFGFIDRFDEVRTDRLHVCIASALLGKRVRLYANGYWKNRAVFEASLVERFSNVVWDS